DRFAVAQITNAGMGGMAKCSDLASRCFQGLRAAGANRNSSAGLRESKRDRPADAATTAAHDGTFSAEVEGHAGAPRWLPFARAPHGMAGDRDQAVEGTAIVS